MFLYCRISFYLTDKKCVGKNESFKKHMSETMKKYRKGFRDLTIKERHKQIEAIARGVMCCCVGKKNVDDEISMKGYIKKNLELASNLLNFLSEVQ